MVPPFFRMAIGRVTVLLFGYFVTRLFHLFWNSVTYSQIHAVDVAMAFVHGLRFDLAAILMTNLPLLPLWMMPWAVQRQLWFRRLELFLFAAINFVALGMNFVDAEFVKFIGKRSSYDLLMIRDDVERQSLSVIWTYRGFFIGLTLLTLFLVWIAPRIEKDSRPFSWLRFIFWRIALILLVAVGIRGGFQFKPLHPMHAYFTTSKEVGLLTLNTPFNILRTKPRMTIERTRFFEDDKQASKLADEATRLSRPPLGVAKKWNVVLLILESFSTEYTGIANNGKGYTPFIDELARESFYFRNNFANARRSIEGLPAILCGMPGIMLEPVITSDFSNNRMDCLPKILEQNGYSTYFLHGAHNGSMHFDTFSKIAGFQNFVGLNEYPKDNPEDLDKYWGVLDEPMLQYAAKVMDKAKRPAMVGVFTLSSHHPYYIPPKYAGRFPKGTLEIHESIGYTDYSLRRFFETAKTKDWYNSTIFVITADHTQKSDQPKYADMLGGFRVPLLIYVPGLKDKIYYDPNRVTQHADIVPSVLDLLGIQKTDRLLSGHSVFDEYKDGFAYNFTTASYWYIDSKRFVDLGHGAVGAKAWTHQNTFELQPLAGTPPEVQAAEQKLKAIVHYLNVGLLNNSLHIWK